MIQNEYIYIYTSYCPYIVKCSPRVKKYCPNKLASEGNIFPAEGNVLLLRKKLIYYMRMGCTKILGNNFFIVLIVFYIYLNVSEYDYTLFSFTPFSLSNSAFPHNTLVLSFYTFLYYVPTRTLLCTYAPMIVSACLLIVKYSIERRQLFNAQRNKQKSKVLKWTEREMNIHVLVFSESSYTNVHD